MGPEDSAGNQWRLRLLAKPQSVKGCAVTTLFSLMSLLKDLMVMRSTTPGRGSSG